MQFHPSGTLIANRYEVVVGPSENARLKGGMGLVYLCVDHGVDGLPVALKTFQPQLLSDRRSRDLFLREGTTWVELGKHPHIVRCHQVITETVGLGVFLVLELVAAAEGKHDASLRSWLSGKALDQEQALRFALQLAYGMQHATMKIPSLVHRDLKPENILVGQDDRARITDFGLVQAMQGAKGNGQVAPGSDSEQGNLHRTQLTHGVAGTPAYMAPEQWQAGKLTAATDIYAFGCILYEMLTGRMAQENAKGAFKLALDIPGDLPSELKAFLLCCLERQPEKRFNKWNEAAEALTTVYTTIMGKMFIPERANDKETANERIARGYSLNALGISYLHIGKLTLGRDYFDKVLAISQNEKDRRLEGAALSNLGNAYSQLGDAQRALKYGEQALYVSREIGHRLLEGQALANIGNAYSRLGNTRRAVTYIEQRLAIARELGDQNGQGIALGDLGRAYFRLGDVQRAIGYLEQSLAIKREIGDRHGEGVVLGNLGTAYGHFGLPRRAIGYFEQELSIAHEIGDRHGEATALGNLGLSCLQLNDTQRAAEYLKQSLKYKRNIGDAHGAAETNFNLALLLMEQQDFTAAQNHARAAAEFFSRIGPSKLAQRAQALLAKIQAQQGQ